MIGYVHFDDQDGYKVISFGFDFELKNAWFIVCYTWQSKSMKNF